ncbi:MAG: hypothetical protein GX350_02335 [Erysipelotrichaceae bacterium]|nr:hypothetical protein [Erysipelotrichaceae bacterium]
MKRNLLSGLLLIALTTASCGKQTRVPLISYNGDIVVSNEPSTIKLSIESFGYLYNNDLDFILFLSSNTCPSCIEFIPTLEAYLLEHQTLIYEFNVSLNSFEGLLATYPEAINYFYTPSIHLFKDGEVSYVFSNLASLNVKQLHAKIRDNSKMINHYFFQSEALINGPRFKEKYPNALTLDLSNPSEAIAYKDLVTESSDERTYIINEAFLST